MHFSNIQLTTPLDTHKMKSGTKGGSISAIYKKQKRLHLAFYNRLIQYGRQCATQMLNITDM